MNKCSAWKDFISSGSLQVPNKYWVQRNFESSKILGLKTFELKEIVRQKIFTTQINVWSQKLCLIEILGLKKKKNLKKKMLGLKNLGPNKFWVRIFFGSNKISGLKNLGPKTI